MEKGYNERRRDKKKEERRDQERKRVYRVKKNFFLPFLFNPFLLILILKLGKGAGQKDSTRLNKRKCFTSGVILFSTDSSKLNHIITG